MHYIYARRLESSTIGRPNLFLETVRTFSVQAGEPARFILKISPFLFLPSDSVSLNFLPISKWVRFRNQSRDRSDGKREKEKREIILVSRDNEISR